MMDIRTVPAAQPLAASAALVSGMPTSRRTRARLVRVWVVSLLFFGYGPAFTYGALTWLLNDAQWTWTYLMYSTLVPLVGGTCVLFLPWHWFRPVYVTLVAWERGATIDQQVCARIYEQVLRFPLLVARSAFAAAVIGYVMGTSVVHIVTNQPWIEIAKTVPAIPLVGGMMGAFCYFGTIRALHPVVAWCSRQLVQPPTIRHVPMAFKFLTTTFVLAIAVLCLLLPTAYTLGQRITEENLLDRVLTRLRLATQQMAPFERAEDRLRLLQKAALGVHGYVFAVDSQGEVISPHPQGYTTLAQERLYQMADHLRGREGAWVDRVGQHRVIAFVQLANAPETFFSVALPSDFALPLRHFILLSGVIVVEVLILVTVFGRYYTRGITTPLAELTKTAERIAQQGDLEQRVPVTTDDELSELARSFNRMVEELQGSKANLEDYTKRLEHSTRELSALNQEMEDLLRVVSHDLRAPLINVQGFSKRLEPLMEETVKTLDQIAAASETNGMRNQVEALKGNLQHRVAESLRFISKGVEKMDILLSSLLAISRVGRKADPIQVNDLNDLLDDVLSTFSHQLQERAIQVIRHPLPTDVPCRRNEINQVFSNLISNAINYMGASEQRFIEIGATSYDDRIECFIQDTGLGIGPEDHERIFHMFTRLQAVDVPGEGIGLAYVKRILRSHGGRIWVVSSKGQGSTFFFTLPRQPVAAYTQGRSA